MAEQVFLSSGKKRGNEKEGIEVLERLPAPPIRVAITLQRVYLYKGNYHTRPTPLSPSSSRFFNRPLLSIIHLRHPSHRLINVDPIRPHCGQDLK